MKSYDELVEAPDPGCDSVASLFEWSIACPHPTPAMVFSDLIGVSEEVFATQFCHWGYPRMDYVGLSKLAAALEAYATRPNNVREYTQALWQADDD